MSNDIELKPCPFCGKNVEIYEETLCPYPYYTINCCSFNVPTKNKDKLIKEWNKRVDNDKNQ